MTNRESVDEIVNEEGWPCQRLRTAYGLILFFFFETTIGRHLPELLTFVMLGAGIALFVSAQAAIRDWKQEKSFRFIEDAFWR